MDEVRTRTGTAESGEDLRRELLALYRGFVAAGRVNPQDNPVERLAAEISQRFAAGELPPRLCGDLVQVLTRKAFLFRADRLAHYVGDCDAAANLARFRSRLESLAQPHGDPIPFESFRDQMEREVFGIVITAHPTFGLSRELTRALATLATGRGKDGQALSDDERSRLLAEVEAARHGNPDRITLDGEQEFALEAIAHIQDALRQVYGVILDVAAELYPDRWLELTPRLMTVASWVGYDVDGRADIPWNKTLLARLREQRLQIQRYLAAVRASIRRLSDAGALAHDLSTNLRLAESRLVLADRTAGEDMDLAIDDCTDVDVVQALGRHFAETRETRLGDVAELVTLLSRAAELTGDPGERRRLVTLRAEMANYGLSMAHTHVRLNATQLVNAIRKSVGLESAPDEPGSRRSYLKALNDMLDRVEPATVNVGSIIAESTSARRLVMTVAQILRYVDSSQPVRFLIAEADTAFTVLAALYFARLFGVEDRLDISPLFETETALRHGHDMVAELLANDHYRAYVRRRGRLCIQTGFSDAGRYLGQVAASLAIERLRIKVADALARHGVTDVEVVIFDTHGESIGRGAHPVSIEDRLDYVATPASRQRFAAHGMRLKQEVSFQGGDGYVFFATPELALATVCRLLEHTLIPPAAGGRGVADDAFYDDTDHSLEFFLTIKGFNEQVMDNPDYTSLLAALGSNILYPSGSRTVKRQHEGRSSIDLGHPSQIRAIPQNSILQQMGFLANSVSGVGTAVGRDRDRFAEVYMGSDRCRRFMRLVAYAYNLSDLHALAAYIHLYDPVFWLGRARAEVGSRRDQMLRLARLLGEGERTGRLGRIHRVLMQDAVDLESGMAVIDGDALLPDWAHRCDDDLRLMHALRIGVIQEIFLLIARVPRFSSQPDITVDEVLADLLHLDVLPAVTALQKAFPRRGQPLDGDAFGEPATYRSESAEGYEEEHEEIFAPMLALYDLVRRLSSSITHVMGAVG